MVLNPDRGGLFRRDRLQPERFDDPVRLVGDGQGARFQLVVVAPVDRRDRRHSGPRTRIPRRSSRCWPWSGPCAEKLELEVARADHAQLAVGLDLARLAPARAIVGLASRLWISSAFRLCSATNCVEIERALGDRSGLGSERAPVESGTTAQTERGHREQDVPRGFHAPLPLRGTSPRAESAHSIMNHESEARDVTVKGG